MRRAMSRISKFQNGPPMSTTLVTPLASHTLNVAGRRDTNIALGFHLRRGDVEKAFAAAEQVFERTFRTHQTMHTPLEPHVAVADVRDGSATIHSSTQNPSFVRIEIAQLLGWPENRVRVKTAFLGGWYFIVPPRFSFGMHRGDMGGLIILLLTGVLLVGASIVLRYSATTRACGAAQNLPRAETRTSGPQARALPTPTTSRPPVR